MGVHKWGKSQFFTLGLIMASGRGYSESLMALADFLSIDITAKSPSDNILFNKSGGGVKRSCISRRK